MSPYYFLFRLPFLTVRIKRVPQRIPDKIDGNYKQHDQQTRRGNIVAGMPLRHILFSEILPNTVAPILVYATSVLALSMLDEAALPARRR